MLTVAVCLLSVGVLVSLAGFALGFFLRSKDGDDFLTGFVMDLGGILASWGVMAAGVSVFVIGAVVLVVHLIET